MDHYNGARYMPAPTWVDMLAPDPIAREDRQYKKHDRKKKGHHKHKSSKKDQERYERHMSELMGYPPPQAYQVIEGDYRPIGPYPPPGCVPNSPWLYPVPHGHHNGNHKKHKKKEKKHKAKKLQKPTGPVPYFGFLPPPPEDHYSRHIDDPRYDRLPRELDDPAGFFGDHRQAKKRLPRTNYFEDETPENPTYATTITRSSVGDTLERPSPRTEAEPEPERVEPIIDDINPYGEHIAPKPQPQPQLITGPSVFMTINPNPVYAVVNKRKSKEVIDDDDAIHPAITEAVLKDFDKQFADFDTTPQPTLNQPPPPPPPPPIAAPTVDNSPHDFGKSRRVLTAMLGERLGTFPNKSENPEPVVSVKPKAPTHNGPRLSLPPDPVVNVERYAPVVNAGPSIVVKERIECPREINEEEKTYDFPIEEDYLNYSIEDLGEVKLNDEDEGPSPTEVCRVIGGLPEEQEAYVREVEKIGHSDGLHANDVGPAEVSPEIEQYLLESIIPKGQEPQMIVPEQDLYPPQAQNDVPANHVEGSHVLPCDQGDIAYQRGCKYAEEHPIVPEQVQLLYPDNKVNAPPSENQDLEPKLPPMQAGPAALRVDLRTNTEIIEQPEINTVPAVPEQLLPAQPKPCTVSRERVDLRAHASTIPRHPPASNDLRAKLYDGPPELQIDDRQIIRARADPPAQDLPGPAVQPSGTLGGVRFQSAFLPVVNLNSNNNNNTPAGAPIQQNVPLVVPPPVLTIPPTVPPNVQPIVQPTVHVQPIVPPTVPSATVPSPKGNLLQTTPAIITAPDQKPPNPIPTANLPPNALPAQPILLQPGALNVPPQGEPNEPEGFFPVKKQIPPNVVPATLVPPSGPIPEGIPNNAVPVPILENSGLPEGYYYLNPAVPVEQNVIIPGQPGIENTVVSNPPVPIVPVPSNNVKRQPPKSSRVPVQRSSNPPIPVIPPPSNTFQPGIPTEIPGLPGKYYIIDPTNPGVPTELPEGFVIVNPPQENSPTEVLNIQNPTVTNVPQPVFPVTQNIERQTLPTGNPVIQDPPRDPLVPQPLIPEIFNPQVPLISGRSGTPTPVAPVLSDLQNPAIPATLNPQIPVIPQMYGGQIPGTPQISDTQNTVTPQTYIPAFPAAQPSGVPNTVNPPTYTTQTAPIPGAYTVPSSEIPTTTNVQNPAIPATSAIPATTYSQDLANPASYAYPNPEIPAANAIPEVVNPQYPEISVIPGTSSGQYPATPGTSELLENPEIPRNPENLENPENPGTTEAANGPATEGPIDKNDTDSDESESEYSETSSEESDQPEQNSKNKCTTQ